MRICKQCGTEETAERRWKPNQQCCGHQCATDFKKQEVAKKNKAYIKPSFCARGAGDIQTNYNANAVADAEPRKLIIPILDEAR